MTFGANPIFGKLLADTATAGNAAAAGAGAATAPLPAAATYDIKDQKRAVAANTTTLSSAAAAASHAQKKPVARLLFSLSVAAPAASAVAAAYDIKDEKNAPTLEQALGELRKLRTQLKKLEQDTEKTDSLFSKANGARETCMATACDESEYFDDCRDYLKSIVALSQTEEKITEHLNNLEKYCKESLTTINKLLSITSDQNTLNLIPRLQNEINSIDINGFHSTLDSCRTDIVSHMTFYTRIITASIESKKFDVTEYNDFVEDGGSYLSVWYGIWNEKPLPFNADLITRANHAIKDPTITREREETAQAEQEANPRLMRRNSP